eukprot:sb/3473904/
MSAFPNLSTISSNFARRASGPTTAQSSLATLASTASRMRMKAEEAELSEFEQVTVKERLEELCASNPTIDLHGYTIPEAKRMTLCAVEAAKSRGYPCLTLITGKGLHSAGRFPRLKRSLKPFLTAQQLRDNILVFSWGVGDGGR